MSLNVEIRVDAPQAISTTNQVESALGKVETRGKSATDALAKGFGNSSTAAEKTKQSTESLTDRMARLAGSSSAFTGFEDHFSRMQAALERIHGPAREYQSDLKAIDDLLERGMISTQQYADQVTLLNRRIGERPTPPKAAEEPEAHGINLGDLGKAVGSQFGEVGNMFSTLASKGAIEAAAISAVSVEVVHLGDEYIELSNKALKFADATHSTDQVISDQLDLSQKLHSGLDATMEIYDSIRDGTDELNLSYEQQIRLTQSVGEAVQLSGKSLQEAGGFMQRLSYDFASGTLTGRELRSMMRQLPDVAELWTSSLGKSRKQLIQMADDGKLSAKDLMNVFITAGDALDSKFGKRTETMGQQWQHFKDTLVTSFGKIVEGTGIITLLGGALSVLGGILAAIAKVVETVGGLIGSFVTSAVHFVETVANATGITKAFSVVFSALGSVFSAIGTAAHAVGEAMSWLGDKLSSAGARAEATLDSMGGFFGGLSGMLDDAMGRTKIAGDAIQTAIESLQKSSTMVDANKQAWDNWLEATYPVFGTLKQMEEGVKVTGAALAEMPKLLGDMNTHVVQLATSVGLLNDSWGESPNAVFKANSAFVQGSKIMLDSKAAIATAKVELAGLEAAFKTGQLPIDQYIEKHKALITTISGGSTPAWEAEAAAMKKAESDMTSLRVAMDTGQIAAHRAHEQFKALATVLNGGELPATIKQFDAIHDPIHTYTEDVRALNGLLSAGAISWDQYDQQMQKVAGEAVDPLIQLVDRLSKPMEDMHRGVATASEAFGQGRITLSQFNDEVERLQKAANFDPNEFKDFASVTNGLPKADLSSVPSLPSPAGPTTAATALDKYREAHAKLIAELEHAKITYEDYGEEEKKLRDGFDKFKTPTEEYAAQLKKIQEAQAVGTSSAEAFDEAMRKLRMQYGQGTFADGIADGFDKIKSSVGDSASIISKTMTSAFDTINSSLEDLIENGTQSFEDFAKSIEKLIVQMTLKLVESNIIGALNGNGGGGGGGSGSQDALSAAASVIKGSWAGSETTIPHAANGYAGRVGGAGGVDTRLFAAMVSPGETVRINTPEQMKAEQRQGGSPPINVNVTDDSRGQLKSHVANGGIDVELNRWAQRNKGALQALLRR